MTTVTKHIFALAVFGAFLFITTPTVFWGDGGFVIASSYALGVPHPTGHPLFSTLGKISTLLPLGNLAFRLNLLAIVLCVGAYYLVFRLTRDILDLLFGSSTRDLFLKDVVSLSVAVGFFLSPIVIDQAVAVETYSLNLFLSLLIIVFVFKSMTSLSEQETRASKNLLIACFFLSGLAFGNHTLLMACLFMSLIGYFFVKTVKAPDIKLALFSLLFFLLGFSVYFYLPLRAHQNPLVNLGNPDTLSNLVWVVSGEQFRENTFSIHNFIGNFNLDNLIFTTMVTVKTLARSLHYQWIGFVALGLVILGLKRKSFFFFVTSLILISVFSTYPPTFATGLSLEDRGISGYYLVPLALFFVFGGAGLGYLLGFLRRAIKSGMNFFVVLVCLILIFTPVLFFEGNIKKGRAEDYSARIWGRKILGSLGYDSLFMSVSDAGLFVNTYLQACEDFRADISIINRSMFFSESGLKFLKIQRPRLFEDYSEAPLLFDSSQFSSFIGRLSAEYYVCFETGTKFIPSGLDFYPNLLVFCEGNNLKAMRGQDKKIESLVSYLKSENFISHPSSMESYSINIYNIGNFLMKKERYSQAIRHYKSAALISPDMKEAYVNLQAAYIRAGMYEEAVTLGSKLKGKFRDPAIYYNYAVALINSGREKEGRMVLTEGAKIFGGKFHSENTLPGRMRN